MALTQLIPCVMNRSSQTDTSIRCQRNIIYGYVTIVLKFAEVSEVSRLHILSIKLFVSYDGSSRIASPMQVFHGNLEMIVGI